MRLITHTNNHFTFLTSNSVYSSSSGSGTTASAIMPIQMLCGGVIGCMHGACSGNGCKCDDEYEGLICDNRKDPCASTPCGSYGKCVENLLSSLITINVSATRVGQGPIVTRPTMHACNGTHRTPRNGHKSIVEAMGHVSALELLATPVRAKRAGDKALQVDPLASATYRTQTALGCGASQLAMSSACRLRHSPFKSKLMAREKHVTTPMGRAVLVYVLVAVARDA